MTLEKMSRFENGAEKSALNIVSARPKKLGVTPENTFCKGAGLRIRDGFHKFVQ